MSDIDLPLPFSKADPAWLYRAAMLALVKSLRENQLTAGLGDVIATTVEQVDYAVIYHDFPPLLKQYIKDHPEALP